ncbi:WD40 repeat-like protein, partial [Punctularia strigosozonata HHB-11173 SS5]|uniref:WD40 repeat-like protein n=1 Tax=Punctularia strigosozonata (strain HHB-11173) TaxID=741275 RepID=UPI0004417E4B
EKRCLEDTRVPLIQLISNWISSGFEPLFLLHGPAGSGKSAVAHSVAEWCKVNERLGCIFCFSSSIKDRQFLRLFPTIAASLANFDVGWKKALCDALKGEHDLSTTDSLERQFNGLLVGPAKDVEARAIGPIVIIIDALDESGDEKSRATLLPYIARLAKLSSALRFVITSRDEQDIMDAFDGLANRDNQKDIMDPVRRYDIASLPHRDVDADIHRFIESRLLPVRKITADPRWDAGLMLNQLVTAAQSLFHWASTACTFIRGEDEPKDYNWHDRFQAVLSSASGGQNSGPEYRKLDSLYKTILEKLYGKNPSEHYERVMGCALTVREPVSLRTLEQLLHNHEEPDRTSNLLKAAGSLMYGVLNSDTRTRIRPLHSSFREFLTDAKRSGNYHVHVKAADDLLAQSSLRIMTTYLKFNICHLETSYKLNDEYDGLDQRIPNNMTPGLIYAVRYWAQHIHIGSGPGATLSPGLLPQIDGFLKTRALFWLEALSLLKSLQSGSSALLTLKRALTASDVLRLVEDLDRFLSLYWDVISISAPHIYLSALPFTPETSLVSQNYMEFFPESARVSQGRLAHWPALRCTMQGHRYGTRSVQFSHDGKWIVSGSEDCTVRMWDAESGQAVGKPFEGHTGEVYSVAFSSDGRHIISASADNTIRMWDTSDGKAIGEPFRGHTDKVNSVAFSPRADDPRAVSGSDDRTIRLWDTSTGQMLGEPMKGHTDGVYSVGFSPDGTRLVSGSKDHTIRTWDAQSQEVVAGPLSGHDDSVDCVAFSPDSKRVVMGSRDGTIRVWDAESGQTIVGPLVGHTSGVTSASFSPDGKYITGKALGESLRGHHVGVTSLSLSPIDGKRLVSGSMDETLRIWDVETRKPVGEPLQGHTDEVNSVAYSSDGSRIVSGSDDVAVRLHARMKASFGLTSWGSVDDGWILGPNDERLLWVPQHSRWNLWQPASRLFLPSEETTMLDLSRFVHGKRWAECYKFYEPRTDEGEAGGEH